MLKFIISFIAASAILISVTGCNTTSKGGAAYTSDERGLHNYKVPDSTAKERLILYGGFGLLHGKAQPEFTKIWKAKNYQHQELRGRLERAAIKAIRSADLPISNYPVAVSNDDVLNILSDRTGKKHQWVKFEDIEKYFSRVYVLIVTAGLELHAVVPYRSREFKQYGHHFISGASAMLVELGGDLGGSRVILSTTALREIEERRTKQTLDPGELTAKFAIAYEKAAVAAIEDLHQLAQVRGLEAIDELSDRSMVTSVIIDDKVARDLFNFQSAKTDLSCRISTPCQLNSASCTQLASLIAHKSTEVLGRQGDIMLPPLRWAAWGGLAGEHTAVTLGLSRGIDVIEDTIKINVSDRSADKKVAGILNGVGHDDNEVKGTKKLFHRSHIASLRFCHYTTDPFDSDKVLLRQVGNSFNNGNNANQELRVIGELPNPPDVERAFKIMSIWNALESYK
ncbi:MAG: hypothetical protein L3J26_09910 [Candidatus Polarisedimenticolaceae bacterium]|nr:hypothetical protein [Candidatus Polarisedimenticolaceae bacterium]